jgi:cation diffusion facilitator CzcD-associated flavoprotein CzcO
MARETAHITMLQRPSYVFPCRATTRFVVLRRVLPDRWVYGMARRRNLFLQRLIYKLSKRWPDQMRSLLLSSVKKHVGKDFDMGHFSPHYKPWDERLCAVPDGDLFNVLRDGKASIVTDHIETFTENGIRLKSGKELQADIIVTATGLQLQSLGGMELRVDGQARAVSELMT